MNNNQNRVFSNDRLTIDLDKILGIKAFDLQAILKLEPTFLTDSGEDHQHNPNVNSFTMKYPGTCDLERLNKWINEVLAKHQQDIFRMKGILAVEGFEDKFVFQGVHMIFQLAPTDAWKKDEKKENTLVFIGRKMVDIEKDLRKGFEYCLMSTLMQEAMAANEKK